MTEPNTPIFEPAVEQFRAYYETVRGNVRQEVIRTRIQPVVRNALSPVLDYGGGDGRDSIWVAQQGLFVHYWDPSPSENELAREAVQDNGLEDRIKILERDPLQVIMPRYDLIMLHGVVQYAKTEDAKDMMRKLSGALFPKGILSLATSNFAVVSGEQESEGVKVSTNNLGLESRAYSAEYIASWLCRLGFSYPDIKGVRCLSDQDFRRLEDVPGEELENILAQEKHWTTRQDSIEYGKMLHAVATRHR